MSCRITKERCFECRNGAALIAITAVGAFPDWWKTGWKYGRVEGRIGSCQIEVPDPKAWAPGCLAAQLSGFGTEAFLSYFLVPAEQL